jgi:hypothetical protein
MHLQTKYFFKTPKIQFQTQKTNGDLTIELPNGLSVYHIVHIENIARVHSIVIRPRLGWWVDPGS